MTPLAKRVIDLSYKHKLSHLSSVLTTLPVIENIYNVKKDDEIFVLGNSHAALALWVVLEKHGLCDAEEMVKKHGTHAFRDIEHGVYVSGGSLGQPETVAIGMAIANKNRNVYLVTSDGACAEGSIWESLRIAAEQKLENLRIAVIMNGQSAIGEIDTEYLEHRLKTFYPLVTIKTNMFAYPSFLQVIAGHYITLNKEQYDELSK
jgi:transketolase N-terminal domain/subunit